MNKIIKRAVATVMVMLLLFSCSETEEIKIKPDFTATLTIQNNDITLKGDFSRQIDGTMEYILTQPQNLSGMRYVFSENMFTIYFHNMERSGDIWQNSPVKIVFNAINVGINTPDISNTIMTENGKVSTYMMASGMKAICLDEGKVSLLSIMDTKNMLTSTLGHDKFVVIRPAMAQ